MRKLTLVATLGLVAALIFGTAVSNQSHAGVIVVPNGDFETLYKPGSTTITATIGGGWTQGIGPDAPMDSGTATYSDATTGSSVDIPGWIGADPQGWIDHGGTYNRDTNFPNRQGSVAAQVGTPNGTYYYLANGGQWGNPAGGLIVSDAPLGNVEAGVTGNTYELSIIANGWGGTGATPVVLELLADGEPVAPTYSVDPDLSDQWQEFYRAYDATTLNSFLGKPLTIRLGIGRGAGGTQTRLDQVSLSSVGELVWDNGNGNGNWGTANNWDPDPRIPDAATPATINSGTPLVEADHVALAVRVSGGTLTIGTGNTLTLTNGINSAGTVALENASRISTGSGSIAAATIDGRAGIAVRADNHLDVASLTPPPAKAPVELVKEGAGTLTLYAETLDASNLILANGKLTVAGKTNPSTLPLPTAGLSLHLDASAITGLGDGDPVALWPDSSGNGRNADVEAAVYPDRQPTYKSGGINGEPSLYFDGGVIPSGVPGVPGTPNTDGGDVMRVLPAGGATLAQEVFIVATRGPEYAGDGTNPGCCISLLARRQDGYRIGPHYSGAARGTFAIESYTHPFSEGGEFLVNGTEDRDVRNATEVWTAPTPDGPMILDITAGQQRNWGTLVIGADGYPSGYQPARNWPGHIAEIIMYDGVLTDVEREQVGYYLEQKYHMDTDYRARIEALTMTDTDVTVTGDGELHLQTDYTADLGKLILNGGIVTLTGAPGGITFTGTMVDAPGGGTVGFNHDTSLQLNRIDVVSTDPVTISKGGQADLVLTGANVGSGFQHATFEARQGRLIGVQDAANPFGSGANAAALSVNGGELVLASTATAPGDVTYDNALSVEADGTLTAGAGGVGNAGPLTVTLGSAAKGVQVNNGTLAVRTTDDYVLNVAGNVSGAGTVNATGGTVNISGAVAVANLTVSGAAATLGAASNVTGDVIVTGGSLAISADASAANLTLFGGTLNTHGNRFSVSNTLKTKRMTATVTAGDVGVIGTGQANGIETLNLGGTVTVQGSLAVPAAAPAGAVGVWLFDEDSADDYSGNGYDGQMFGGSYDSGADTAFAGSAGSLNLSAGDHYVLVDTGGNQDVFDLDSITVATWVKGWPDVGWGPFISKRGESGQGWKLRRRGGSNRLTFTLRGTSGADDPTGTTEDIANNPDQWFHVAATYDMATGVRTWYVNGVQDYTDDGNDNDDIANTNSALVFGAQNNDPGNINNVGRYSHVRLDDIYIYDRALTEEEVNVLYNAGAGQAPVVPDATLNNVTGNGTIVGDVIIAGAAGPGDGGVGTINVQGNLEMATASTLQVDVGAADNDLVAVTNVLTLPDAPIIELADAGIGAAGGMTGGKLVLWTYDTFGSDLPSPADLSGDGLVGDEDLNLLLSNFGATGVDVLGDLNGDQSVDALDLAVLLGEFGEHAGVGTLDNSNVSGPAGAGWTWGDLAYAGGEVYLADVNIPAALSAVPEPRALVLLLLGAFGLLPLIRRRRR